MGLCNPCKKTDPVTARPAPAKYSPNVSVKDRLFFLRLLFKWTGSIWQMLWIDLIVFIVLYIIINVFYHFYLVNGKHVIGKANFEKFVVHVQRIAQNVPLSFLLGFFVSSVLGRWWTVCMTIPWMSKPSIMLQCYIAPPHAKEAARKVRLNILRYLNLAWIMAMKVQSLQIFRRFQLPGEKKTDFEKLRMTMEEMFINPARAVSAAPSRFKKKSPVHAYENVDKLEKRFEKINEDPHVKKSFGYLISCKEVDIFKEIGKKSDDPKYQGDYWIPLQWCTRILVKAKQAGLISGDFEFSELIKIVDSVRGSLGTLSVYNDINIPLVYTQVIIIAVYSFFLAEIFSSQLIKAGQAASTTPAGVNATTVDFNSFDNYIPIFSIFKFIFFMGWFKTAASLLNPLGNDNHDLPTSLMLDYNLMISIASGDARDEIYPAMLTYEGDPMAQIEQMDELPEPSITAEAFESHERLMEENKKKTAVDDERLRAEPI